MYPVMHVPAGDVLPILFSSYAGATGASITLTGLAVTDIEIYKDGSVTQRASDAGYVLLDTDGIDFDGITGIHGFSIDTGDNTDAGFYTVGAWFTVVVSAVTVDSQTVNFIAAMFRIMPAETVAAVPKVDISHLLGTAWLAPGTAGTPDVNVKLWNALTTVALPLIPTTAGRTLDVSAGGEAGVDWANVGSPTTALALTGTTIATTQKVDVETIKTNPVVNGGTITFPTTATLASTTNITAGTVTTATNLTNAPTAGDFTATMKTSIGTAVAASAVASVTGNVGGNVVGSTGSVTGLTASDVGAIKAKTDNLPSDPADQSLVIAATNALAALLGTPAGASVSADVAAVKVDTAAVKAKTDSLTFTTAGMVDSAIKRVGDTTLNAAGTGGQGYGA